MSSLLEVDNLGVQFQTADGPFKVVQDISFSINDKETVCIVGESGSGKSVTSLSIMGLLPENGAVTNGSIKLNGEELTSKTENELQKMRGNDFAMIFQEPMTALNPVLTIGFQLSEPLRIHKKLNKEEIRAKSIELLDKVGIPQPEEKLSMYPHELSGGMRQRVMIAMALAGEPSLLIADEPTTALDVTIQAQILELIDDLKTQFDMGVLFVTHDMGVVAEIADRVVVMYHGSIVETGTVEEIFNAPSHPYTQRLLAAVPDVDQPKPEASPDTEGEEPLLQVDNLSKFFPVKTGIFQRTTSHVKAVKNVSFSLYEGETLGLVGESGSGKSTLGRTILGLEEKTNGTIQFNGKDMDQMSKQELKESRKEMQMIFQDPYASLDPRQKIGETIEEILVIHTDLSKKERKNQAMKLLKDSGLSEGFYERLPHELSGGQRQRVGIARAIALNPSLIVADEAVSALDVSIQAQIMDLLKKLQEEYKLTYLFISHDLGVVRQISDRIMVMYLGNVVEIGTADQIFENPQHPYTKMLLSAVPRPVPGLEKERIKKEELIPVDFTQPTEWVEVADGHLIAKF
jgi:ABC-type glutathione transport system ATPase component